MPSGRHNIRLPANARRLNIDEAAAALQQMGYRLGRLQYEPGRGTAYDVTDNRGVMRRMTVDEIRKLVYEAQD